MILPPLARLLIREHIYKPITGRVLCLGRQSVALTLGQYVELLKQEGYPVLTYIVEEAGSGADERTRYGKGTQFISDELFFRMLGITDLTNMDVSAYEGAEIIHNLNYPVSSELYQQFDFIIDGGTFDHLLDLRVAFENVVRLLKVGGRVFQWNAASNFTGSAFLSFSPDFFYDYYVINRFSDCKVYLAEFDSLDASELWDLYEHKVVKPLVAFQSIRMQVTVVLAEKGVDSTSDELPIQIQYRDPEVAAAYERLERAIAISPRQYLSGSITGQRLVGYTASTIASTGAKVRKNGLGWALGKMAHRLTEMTKKRLGWGGRNVPGYRYIGKI